MRRARLLAALLAAALLAGAAAADPLQDALDDARRRFDDAALVSAHEALLARAAERPDDYAAQLAAAEGYVVRASRLRNERKIVELDGEVEDRYRDLQAQWGEAGEPYAERALALASDDAERAQAERVLGELETHRIRGMISGFIHGPRARGHMERALELAPDDVDCRRAFGLMYLHNPPISGGDVPKAIETFTHCSEARPESDRCPVLLAMAYRKDGDPEQARAAAREALRRNPDNADAKHLLAELDAEAE